MVTNMRRLLIVFLLLFCPQFVFATTSQIQSVVRMAKASGGSCSTQSLLVDWSGVRIGNSVSIYESTRVLSTSFVGNGKKIKSITFKTGTDSGSSVAANLYINTLRDFSGTNIGEASVNTPGTDETEFTFDFSSGPTLLNGTTYYIGVASSSMVYEKRFSIAATDTNIDGLYYSTDGLDGPYSTGGAGANYWMKVLVCED